MRKLADGAILLENKYDVLTALKQHGRKILPIIAYREMGKAVQATVYEFNEREIRMAIKREDESLDCIETNPNTTFGMIMPEPGSLCLWVGNVDKIEGDNFGDTDQFQRTTYYPDIEQDSERYLRYMMLIDINKAKAQRQWQ